MQSHYEEKNRAKVALKKQIQKAGFSEQSFPWTDPFTNETGTTTIFNKIRCWGGRKSLDTRHPVEFKGTPTIRDVSQWNHEDKLKYYNQLFDHFQKIDKFFEKYTKIIWYHKESSMRESVLQKYLEDYHSSEARLALQNLEFKFSKKAIELALKPLLGDLNKQWEKYKGGQDYKYHTYLEDTPESDARIDRENDTIHEIRQLYKDYTPLFSSDEKIKWNMAYVFKEINFWPYGRKGSKQSVMSIFSKLTKRFEKIEQMKKEYPAMFSLEK